METEILIYTGVLIYNFKYMMICSIIKILPLFSTFLYFAISDGFAA